MNLHSRAWTDGVICNKILCRILKRIVSAPISRKPIASKERGGALKMENTQTDLPKAAVLPEHPQAPGSWESWLQDGSRRRRWVLVGGFQKVLCRGQLFSNN